MEPIDGQFRKVDMKTETPRPIHLTSYVPSAHLVDQIHLDVRLSPQKTRVRARLSVRPNPAVRRNTGELVLDGEALELVGLRLNGTALVAGDYAVDGDKLTVSKVPNAPFTLEIETNCNPDENTELSGLYRSNKIYCTQCEAEGFRRITYTLDRPDVLARYTTRIEARRSDAPVLLSNGNLVESGDVEGTERHYAVWEDPHPKPSYLFALVGGDLACVEDRFKTMSGRQVALRIYVEHGKEDRCDYAMEALKRSMRWDEEVFGREYDLDIFMIVAVSDFNMGAMENKGLNIFNDKFVLARPDTATDADYANIEAIIAHEYFHNWTGNRITCRDWFQLCLKEGLTVFRDQEFSSDMRSRPVKRIADVKLLRSHQFPEDAGPLAHPVRPSSYIEINNFYTATVYEKGAEVIRMLQTILGRDVFMRAMGIYFERHDGDAATVEDFVRCMEDASGRDLTQFMRWYTQAGTPELTIAGKYSRKDETFELAVTQATRPTPGQRKKKPLMIPLALGLMAPDGTEHPLDLEGVGHLEQPVIEITGNEHTFRFRGIPEKPVASLNRDFSAPVKLASNLSDDDLRFLMAGDGDPFNRWESCQIYAGKRLLENVERAKRGEALQEDDELAGAFKACLADHTLEPEFVSLMLALPAENDLAARIGSDVDHWAIHEARDHMKACLGRTLAQELAATYDRLIDDGPYVPDAESAGKRSLKNAALALITAAQGPALAFEQFRAAGNMTDRMGALTVLAVTDTEERVKALAEFYESGKSDHLLVDKWFMLSAMAPFADKITEIRALSDHPAFSLKTPNKVRALVGTFSTANPVCFNHKNGAGYRFLADVVLALDPINPQVAARLSAAFKSWRVLEPGRRELARKEIERIKARKKLSRDTFEIVSKTLK